MPTAGPSTTRPRASVIWAPSGDSKVLKPAGWEPLPPTRSRPSCNSPVCSADRIRGTAPVSWKGLIRDLQTGCKSRTSRPSRLHARTVYVITGWGLIDGRALVGRKVGWTLPEPGRPEAGRNCGISRAELPPSAPGPRYSRRPLLNGIWDHRALSCTQTGSVPRCTGAENTAETASPTVSSDGATPRHYPKKGRRLCWSTAGQEQCKRGEDTKLSEGARQSGSDPGQPGRARPFLRARKEGET